MRRRRGRDVASVADVDRLFADVERVIEAKAKGLGISNEEMRGRLLQSVSLRTAVSAQDVANTALFLASEAGGTSAGRRFRSAAACVTWYRTGTKRESIKWLQPRARSSSPAP